MPTQAEFEVFVGNAMDLVPEPFREALEEVAVVVEAYGPPHMGPLFGLYQGVPRTRPEGSGFGQLPPRITLYMHPMVDRFHDPGQLTEQIRITLLHELGHHLGMDEQQLEELGYG
ncbi:MAG: metallopeptidase family protein [Thermoleophilia bacterium]